MKSSVLVSQFSDGTTACLAQIESERCLYLFLRIGNCVVVSRIDRADVADVVPSGPPKLLNRNETMERFTQIYMREKGKKKVSGYMEWFSATQ